MAGDPLDVLLSHAVLELTRAAERAVPGLNVVQWSNFLRVADGTPKKGMHLAARVSKRAVQTCVARLSRSGAVVVDADGVCWLTDAGRASREAGRAAIDGACAAFESRHGDALRRALTPVVASFEWELAHYLNPYGSPDPSITGGRPHGADWRPVVRARDVDTTSDLSILALLSQALTAYSIDYEQRAGPMVWGVYLARHPGVPLPFAGTFERHRFSASAVRRAYAPTTAAIESSWRSQHGDALRDALEAVDASLTARHADHPAVVFLASEGFVERSG